MNTHAQTCIKHKQGCEQYSRQEIEMKRRIRSEPLKYSAYLRLTDFILSQEVLEEDFLIFKDFLALRTNILVRTAFILNLISSIHDYLAYFLIIHTFSSFLKIIIFRTTLPEQHRRPRVSCLPTPTQSHCVTLQNKRTFGKEKNSNLEKKIQICMRYNANLRQRLSLYDHYNPYSYHTLFY